MPGWNEFKDIIFQVLLFLERLTGDWGLGIILLTVAVRILLMPLTIRQTKSMYELQRIQPKLKELQVKYKDDKEKLQEETLKFYQEHKVNPFGGCLPMILQMPLFIALYQVLASPADKPGMANFLQSQGVTGSFLGIIHDLTMKPSQVFSEQGIFAALPYLILVALFAISIWLPQALMPGEKSQKMITAYMAVLMLWFGWQAPAGVLLYWDVSSIWQVVQQQVITVSMKRSEEHAAVVPELPAAEDQAPAATKAKSGSGSGKKKRKK